MKLNNHINCCLLMLSFSSCTLLRVKDKVQENGIKVTQVFPVINAKGKLLFYDTSSIYIFNMKNLVLFKLNYQFDSISNKKQVMSERRIHYFVFQKGKPFGYDYDVHKSDKGKKLSLDSAFKQEWCIQNNLYPIFKDSSMVKLLSRYKNYHSGNLKESYVIKNKPYGNHSGTAFLEYSNSFKDVEYSLSKEMDSIKKMKLYKVRIGYDPIKLDDTMTIDRFETYYEIQRVGAFDRQEIFGYFERFQHEKL